MRRVSTQDQSTNLQLDALAKVGCARVFSESASGAQRDRPELARALDYMRPGDTLVVWKLDRLARSLKQLIETVESLEGKGIGFRSLTESIDTTTAGGKLTFHIFVALNEFERSMIRERTRAGLDAARARGRVGGRPRSLTDKDLEMAKTLLANPDITVEEVAARLSVAPATLYRYLPGGRGAICAAACCTNSLDPPLHAARQVADPGRSPLVRGQGHRERLVPQCPCPANPVRGARAAGQGGEQLPGDPASPQSELAQQITKDPYLFDFLNLREDANEREVETGLLGHVERSLSELGAGFALVGRMCRRCDR